MGRGRKGDQRCDCRWEIAALPLTCQCYKLNEDFDDGRDHSTCEKELPARRRTYEGPREVAMLGSTVSS